MTSPYVEYLLREKAGIVLTVSATAKSVTSLPTASTTPAQSYPRPAGNIGDSTYLSLRHIESARLMPIAFTSMRTSCGPGAGTSISMNSRTSGPPAFANLMVRDMIVSLVCWHGAELRLLWRIELAGLSNSRQSLSLSLNCFNAVGNRNPALRTLHPDEGAGSKPACVIESAGFDGEYILCGLQNMIDADAALGAKHTRHLVAAVGDTRKSLRRAG